MGRLLVRRSEPAAAQRMNAQTREGRLVPVYGVNRPFFHVDRGLLLRLRCALLVAEPNFPV
jgi:hypothetical protein